VNMYEVSILLLIEGGTRRTRGDVHSK